MSNQRTLLICLLSGVFLFAGCSKGNETQAPATGAPASSDAAKPGNKAELPRPVRFVQVGLTGVGNIAYLPGEVRPRFEQRYGFRVAGKIASRLVDIGQEVKAGQVLAVLDAQDVLPAIQAQEAQVEVARSDFQFQQSELKRQRELRAKGFISGAGFERQTATTDAAQSRLLAAQSQLANVRNSLDFQTLRADKAGVVVGVDAEAGAVVASGQSVIRLAQLAEKEIAVNVPERVVALMKQASGFTATLDALANKTYTAKLRELSPAADPASRTYSARLSVINADDAMKIGMSASVRLAFGETQAIVLPNSALYTRDDATRVWLIDRTSETVQPVTVKVGQSTNDGITIVSGLNIGDLVVTAGANLLLPGQKVRLLEVPGVAKATGQGAGKP
ncbi:MAG: efflux RND transporter periplasmic adaptor subunit [Proteobacteria bacterium]|nr:efflux RND transporter periplasmic adaptor subunit [Pseudomonadota bacterium]